MSILQRLESLDEDTPEARVRRNVARSSREAITRFREAMEDGAHWVWSNPEGMTPQQAFDALGTSGQAVCAAHANGYAYLQSVSGDAPFVPPQMPVFQSDGRVKLQPWPEGSPQAAALAAMAPQTPDPEAQTE